MLKCCLATDDGIGSKLLKSPSWADTRQREWRAESRHRENILRSLARAERAPGSFSDRGRAWNERNEGRSLSRVEQCPQKNFKEINKGMAGIQN